MSKSVNVEERLVSKQRPLMGVFTVGTACATEGLYIDIYIIIIFDHPLYDPSTEQLSHLKLLFEPMQLPSFLPVAACVLL